MDLENRVQKQLAEAAFQLLEFFFVEAPLWEMLLLLLWISLCLLRRVIDEVLTIVGSKLVHIQHTEEDLGEHRDVREEQIKSRSDEDKSTCQSGLSAHANENDGEENINRNRSEHLEEGTSISLSKLSALLNLEVDLNVMNNQTHQKAEEQMRSDIRAIRKVSLSSNTQLVVEHASSLLPHLHDDFVGPKIWPKLPLHPWAIWQLSQVFRLIGQVVKVCSEADPRFNLAVRNDKVVVVKADDSDLYQQWIKDELWTRKTKELTGLPAFSLINLGSGKALHHSANAEEKVSQDVYRQDSLNGQVLWNISDDVGHGWHAVHPSSDMELCLDIDHGAAKYGRLTEGQAVILFPWNNQENQHWKISPISVSFHDHH